jgi:hypothetical protein
MTTRGHGAERSTAPCPLLCLATRFAPPGYVSRVYFLRGKSDLKRIRNKFPSLYADIWPCPRHIAPVVRPAAPSSRTEWPYDMPLLTPHEVYHVNH